MINARSSGSLHRQVRRMLILCIAVVVLLSTSVGLGIGLYQEVRTRDQLLSNAAQMAADAPLLIEDIRQITHSSIWRGPYGVYLKWICSACMILRASDSVLRSRVRYRRRIFAARTESGYGQPPVQRGKAGALER